MINSLVPFVHVRSVERSIAFYETLGFAVSEARRRRVLVYAPDLEDSDGYVLMVSRGDET